MFRNVIDNFLSKSTPIIGKYFRFVCILLLPALTLFEGWALMRRFDWFFFGIFIFLILLVVFQVFYLRWSRKQKYEPEYEAWGAYFYMLIIVVAIYLFLKLLSNWIGYDIVNHLKYLFSADDF